MLMKVQDALAERLREVDALDDAIHDLLMRRAELAEEIAGEEKKLAGVASARPARRAEILRRLVRRHTGSLPLRSLIRVWCEILAAAAGEQGRLHVYAGGESVLYRDLARTYFGSLTPMIGYGSATAVVQSCSDEPLARGVVPLADIGEAGSVWWAHLAPAGHPGARVVARLPFLADDGGDPPFPESFAIAALEQEPTGDDTTLLLLETQGEMSRTRLQTFLQQAGFDATILAAGAPADGVCHLLLANKGFVGQDDPRFRAFVEKEGDTVLRAAPVGGYANPIDRGLS